MTKRKGQWLLRTAQPRPRESEMNKLVSVVFPPKHLFQRIFNELSMFPLPLHIAANAVIFWNCVIPEIETMLIT
jgi:hypothetical protein